MAALPAPARAADVAQARGRGAVGNRRRWVSRSRRRVRCSMSRARRIACSPRCPCRSPASRRAAVAMVALTGAAAAYTLRAATTETRNDSRTPRRCCCDHRRVRALPARASCARCRTARSRDPVRRDAARRRARSARRPRARLRAHVVGDRRRHELGQPDGVNEARGHAARERRCRVSSARDIPPTARRSRSCARCTATCRGRGRRGDTAPGTRHWDGAARTRGARRSTPRACASRRRFAIGRIVVDLGQEPQHRARHRAQDLHPRVEHVRVDLVRLVEAHEDERRSREGRARRATASSPMGRWRSLTWYGAGQHGERFRIVARSARRA